MADTRQRTTWGTRFRFLIRAVGLAGVLAVFGGVVMGAAEKPPSLGSWTATWQYARDTVRAVLDGNGAPYTRIAVWLLIGGLAAVALALVVEVLGGILLITGRRTAASASATIATVAATVLLIFVNAYSFTHHTRFDYTRTQQFTLPPELSEKLRTLRPQSPTTIVVLQKHKVFGTLSDDRDAFTKAAEEKVTEKVKDLVDLFRELGPRFKVAVLDTEAFGYREQLDDLTKNAPELRDAIESAPENSILFHANKHVQRLAFNEFLQLDKTASKSANDGRGNLVLLPQGVENFARRVLAVQERRPKVAVCVVHEWLSTVDTTGQQEFSLAGLKHALTDHGFDVIDIILKKNWEDSSKELESAAYTVQESKLERLEGELDSAQDQFRAAQGDVKIVAAVRKAFGDISAKPFSDRAAFYIELNRGAQIRGWAEVVRAFRQWVGEESRPISEANEPDLRSALAGGLARQATRAEQEVRDAEKARAEAERAVKAAFQDERSVQDRRISDVKTKFAAALADVDLLIIPRYTLVNVTIGRGIPPSLHTLSKPQVEVIRDFMKAGKPVLACLGSLSTRTGPAGDGTDDLDRLIAERGIELGRDTILYDPEAKAFAAIKAGRQLGGSASDIPPLLFTEHGSGADGAKPNPVGAALQLTGRSVDQKLDLKLHAPRPVYLALGWQKRLTHAAEFVFTSPDSWNEERPFLSADARGRITYTPRYEPTLDSDPKAGTRMAERRGPFPIGVAIESRIPASWVDKEYGHEALVAAVFCGMGMVGGVKPVDSAAVAVGGFGPVGHRAARGGFDPPGLFPLADPVLAAGLTVAAHQAKRPTERLIVFGSGNLFAGVKLEPAQEKLLLHSANWLTRREDRLPHADHPAWSFPRVAMSDRELTLWRLGTAIGLPLVAIYLGLMVMMVRRLR